MIALFLAATLSSSPVGEFYAVPKWMHPGVVSSAMTPGSDDWYVGEKTRDEFVPTNVVVKFARIRTYSANMGDIEYGPDATDSLLGDAVLLPDGSIDITKCVAPPAERGNGTATYYEDDDLWWWSSSTANTSRNRYWLYEGYNPTYVTNGVTVVHTNGIARATRLTPEMHASLIATSEAFHERLHYATLTNRQNAAAAKKLKTKDFGLPLVPTNRTVVSRRLTQYPIVDGIARTLQEMWRGGMKTDVPGWTQPPCWYYIGGDVFWSTSAAPLGDLPCFPEFPWTSDLKSVFRSRTRAPVFASFGGFDQKVWEMSYQTQSTICEPWEHMLAPVAQPDRHDSHEFFLGAMTADEIDRAVGGMTNLLAQSYRYTDAGAVTNATRRLVSDRLATVNQVLGLMDRTVEFPEFSYAGPVTNITYNTRLWADATATVGARIGWNGHSHVAETNGVFGLSDFRNVSTTNWTDATGGMHDHIICSVESDVSGTRLSGNGTLTLASFSTTPEEIVRKLFYNIPDGTTGVNVFFPPHILFNEWTSSSIFVYATVTLTFYGGQRPIGYEQRNIDLGEITGFGPFYILVPTSVAINRSYRTQHTTRDAVPYVVTANGHAKVRSAKAAVLKSLAESFARSDTIIQSQLFGVCPRELNSQDLYYNIRYASSVSDYEGVAGLNEVLLSEYDDLRDRVINRVKQSLAIAAIDDWRNIIPVEIGQATDLARAENLAVDLRLEPKPNYIRPDAYVAVVSIDYVPTGGLWAMQQGRVDIRGDIDLIETLRLSPGDSIGMGSAVITADVSSSGQGTFNHIDTCTAEGRMNLMTDHVWNWDYLKRKDNQ